MAKFSHREQKWGGSSLKAEHEVETSAPLQGKRVFVTCSSGADFKTQRSQFVLFHIRAHEYEQRSKFQVGKGWSYSCSHNTGQNWNRHENLNEWTWPWSTQRGIGVGVAAKSKEKKKTHADVPLLYNFLLHLERALMTRYVAQASVPSLPLDPLLLAKLTLQSLMVHHKKLIHRAENQGVGKNSCKSGETRAIFLCAEIGSRWRKRTHSSSSVCPLLRSFSLSRISRWVRRRQRAIVPRVGPRKPPAASSGSWGGYVVTACLLFSRTRRKHISPLPCLGNRKQTLTKTLPHTDWAGKRWSLATRRFVLQMQTSNYPKVSDRMAALTNVYSPCCCCFQKYLYFMQTSP